MSVERVPKTEASSSARPRKLVLKATALLCSAAAVASCKTVEGDTAPTNAPVVPSSAAVAPGNKTPQTDVIHSGRVPKPGMVVNGTNFFYAGGSQRVQSEGASVDLTQERPFISYNNEHSLMELAVESTDGKQAVEVGWIVNSSGPDAQPELFVFHWADGQSTCYDKCGFVSTSRNVQPGDHVEPNRSATFGIEHDAQGWEVLYNNAPMGYFPDSLWNGQYKRAGLIQVFGEIATGTLYPCDDMGNGDYGASSHAAYIKNFSLVDTATAPHLSPYQSDERMYSYANATPTSMRIGGPGAC